MDTTGGNITTPIKITLINLTHYESEWNHSRRTYKLFLRNLNQLDNKYLSQSISLRFNI